jgi:hypothetical protein
VERYLNQSLIAGPAACVILGVLAWVTGRALCFAGSPALVAARVVVLLPLARRAWRVVHRAA